MDTQVLYKELFKFYSPCQDCGAGVELLTFGIGFSSVSGQNRLLSTIWECKSQYTKWQYSGIEDRNSYSRGQDCLEQVFRCTCSNFLKAAIKRAPGQNPHDQNCPNFAGKISNGVRGSVEEEQSSKSIPNGVRAHVVEDPPIREEEPWWKKIKFFFTGKM